MAAMSLFQALVSEKTSSRQFVNRGALRLLAN
jgi:hypothetical protein